jgi:hypothetical protein
MKGNVTRGDLPLLETQKNKEVLYNIWRPASIKDTDI